MLIFSLYFFKSVSIHFNNQQILFNVNHVQCSQIFVKNPLDLRVEDKAFLFLICTFLNPLLRNVVKWAGTL